MQYGRWPKPPKYTGQSNLHIDYSRPTLPVQAAAQFVQECNATGPSTLQHALPGPSGTQAQTDYANVSIFSYQSISSNVF